MGARRPSRNLDESDTNNNAFPSLRRGKVFGIGLGKTGTTSLAKAMKILGYSAKHGPRTVDEIEAYEFTNDIGVAWRFRLLDHVYPDAKFILTIRDTESWLRSCTSHARRVGVRVALRRLESRFMCFGRTDFEEEHFRHRFEYHNADVVRHFGDRSDRLLVLNICGGEGWSRLCPFLGLPVPPVPFPRANQSGQSQVGGAQTAVKSGHDKFANPESIS